MRRLRVIPLAAIMCALTAPAVADGSPPTVGQHYVAFTLPDIETSKPVSLSDFRGKKVLLIQFASW